MNYKSPQNAAPRHPGLCLNLLDDENRAVVVELVALCNTLSQLPLRQQRVGKTGSVYLVCHVCLAHSPIGADVAALTQKFHHSDHCAITHAKRLLSGDAALRVPAERERVYPDSTYGRALWNYTETLRDEDSTS